MSNNTGSRSLAIVYATTIFTSAFLLFQVQPLIGKYILPWFGGSPAVWTTCMLVFQVLLFGGYAYAHLTTRYLQPRHQGYLHVALLVLALLTLPITPDPSWKPTSGDGAAWRIMLLTLSSVGLPYFILSSTGPLVQGWFSRTHENQSPYRLYALSNIGSLLALVSYPFIVEPSFATTTQSAMWSVLFCGFALLCASGAVWMWQRATPVTLASLAPAAAELVEAPTRQSLALWFGLSMTASVMLLATTNQVCLDVAVIPFLWVLPLALYLLTFILCFDSDRWYVRKPFAIAAAVGCLAVLYVLSRGSLTGIFTQVAVYFSTMFCICMVCHGELVSLKPHPRHLTTYYLTISAGGAGGGLFVCLAAPFLFAGYYELQLGLLAFVLLSLKLMLIRAPQAAETGPSMTRGWGTVIVLGVAMVTLSQIDRFAEGAVVVSRNFYGVLKVTSRETENGERVKNMVHGRIVHGTQFQSPERRMVPTSYYGETTGIGRLLRNGSADQPRHVGVIGLGVGTLATYARPGDRFRFYEINSDVIGLAQNHFTFLSDCAGKTETISGDARLMLELEEDQKFDVLVVDAFSGDAIPAHLLTTEAIAVYQRHLKPNGILAVHISNLHFDLRPLLTGLAQESGLTAKTLVNKARHETSTTFAIWTLLSRDPATLDAIALAPGEVHDLAPPRKSPLVWTDNRSNLMEVLR
jgi:hypothetical protein